MADFVAVLKKTIDGLAENTPAMREKVYQKARSTVAAKLAAISPPPSAAIADRQKQMLEDAIRDVEAAYMPPDDADPFAELENVFAHLSNKGQAAQPAVATAAAPAEPRTPAPAAAETPVLSASQYDPKSRPDQPAEPEVEQEIAAATERPAVHFDGDDEELAEDQAPVEEERTGRRRSFMTLIAAAIVLALVAGGAYAVWLNKDDFMAMLGIGGETVATAPVADQPAPVTTPVPETATKPAEEIPSDTAPADQQGVQKFTQRLNANGSEVDEGPSGGIASIGEGTSVAAVTPPPLAATPEGAAAGAATTPATPDVAPPAGAGGPAITPPADTAAAAPPAPAATDTATTTTSDAQVAVGQKAIFYEERTNVAEGSADGGSVVWSLVQESPGNDQPTEPAIRGEVTVPGKDIQLRMTIRRNADKTLPASHIIELIFLTPDNFEGGGIENILRFALKDTEEAAGSPVLGIPAKIADGYFLVALNDTKAEVETNLNLLKRERWIDVPLVYKSGRRALITMEKGVPGDKVFDEAIKAWQGASASAG